MIDSKGIPATVTIPDTDGQHKPLEPMAVHVLAFAWGRYPKAGDGMLAVCRMPDRTSVKAYPVAWLRLTDME